MQCPYCVSEIAEQALVCPVCTRDLYLFKPLLERQAALQRAVDTQAGEISELKARLQALGDLRDAGATAPAGGGAIAEEPLLAPADRRFWLAASRIVLLALIALHAAAWFVRLIYDAGNLELRLLTIALSLPFGYALARRHAYRVSAIAVPAACLGILAVASWRALDTAFNDAPFVPASLAGWREPFEFAAGMGLAFFTGALVRHAQVLGGATGRRRPPFLMRWLAGLFRGNDKGESGIDALARTIQKVVALITPLATGVTAVYAVVKSLGGAA